MLNMWTKWNKAYRQRLSICLYKGNAITLFIDIKKKGKEKKILYYFVGLLFNFGKIQVIIFIFYINFFINLMIHVS